MKPVNIFVSYSHQDASYIENDSLFGFLKGLESDGVVFWDDRQILPGETWDDVIKANLQRANMALVLVSQSFLDSKYCANVEIQGFLAQQAHIFPVILSPCDWKRHAWLAQRQFLPPGDQTIEEHYKNSGKRKRLYLDIREKIRQIVERIRQESPKPLSTPQPPHPSPEPTRHPPPATRFSGTTKIAFCNRLGHDWKGLADVLGVSAADQARFERGDEARGLWVWLENRRRLPDLVPALADINREDLVRLLKTP